MSMIFSTRRAWRSPPEGVRSQVSTICRPRLGPIRPAPSVRTLAALCFLLLTAVASFKSAGVKRRWATALGTREQILERYPPADADAVARELQRLTAQLGIDTSPRSDDSAPHPATESSANFKHAGRAMAAYRNLESNPVMVSGVDTFPPVTVKPEKRTISARLLIVTTLWLKNVDPSMDVLSAPAPMTSTPDLSVRLSL